MNYLQLAQLLRREMKDTGEGPHNFTNQTGRNLEYVDAIRGWIFNPYAHGTNDFGGMVLMVIIFKN